MLLIVQGFMIRNHLMHGPDILRPTLRAFHLLQVIAMRLILFSVRLLIVTCFQKGQKHFYNCICSCQPTSLWLELVRVVWFKLVDVLGGCEPDVRDGHA